MAIVDNNILSSLAKIDRLELLPSVFETVETPPSVIDELDRADAFRDRALGVCSWTLS